MNDHESEHFIPDKVDEQIASSLAEQPVTQPPDALDKQLVQALQRHYAPGSAHIQPVERVWKRLAQHRASLQSSQGERASQGELQTDNIAHPPGKHHLKLAFSNPQPRNTSFRRLSLVAAVLVAALLVGSMLAVFNLVHQKPATGHSTPTPNKHPAPINADQVYAIVNTTIYRYDPMSHKQLWSFTMPVPSSGAENIGSQAQVMGGVLYTLGTGSDGYYSYAINTSDGSLRWRYKVNYLSYQSQDLLLVGGTQLVASGRVYLSETSPSNGYTLITALNASTGTILWKHRYNNTGISTRNHFVDASAGLSLAAATSEVLYGTTFTGVGNTTIYAISAKDGSVIWQKPVSTDGEQPDQFSVGELIVDGVLCISASFANQSGARHLYGFDATTGQPKWSVPLDGEASEFTASNGIVYLGTTNFQTTSDNRVYIAGSSLYAVRATDGALLWRYKAQAGVSSPVVQNGIVAISVSRQDNTNQQIFIALDANSGKILWSRSASYQFATVQVLASKNFLYVNAYAGQVQVLRLSDGKLIDTFSVPAPLNGSLSDYVDMIVVST